jgi:hypothetical protein
MGDSEPPPSPSQPPCGPTPSAIRISDWWVNNPSKKPTCETRPPGFMTPTCTNRPDGFQSPASSTSSLSNIIAQVAAGTQRNPADAPLLPPIQPVWPRGMTPPAIHLQSRIRLPLSLPVIHKPPSSLALFCQVFGVINPVHRAWFIEGIRLWPTISHLNRPKRYRPPCAVTGKLLERLEECGIIRRTRRAPFVPKSDNTVRLIVNYSRLTPHLKAPKFYLPSIF